MNIKIVPEFLRRSVFISYSHRDSATVDGIVDTLLAARFTCWQDKHELEPPEDFDDKIKEALRRAWTVVVFVSAQSNASKWVLEEAMYALAHRKRIIMVRLDDSPIPAELFALARLQWIHLKNFGDIASHLLSLLRKRRWKLRAAWAARIAAALAFAAVPWFSLRVFEQTRMEIVIESELLPVKVSFDGTPMQTLTSNLPRSTVEANRGVHVIQAQHGRLRAEKRIQGDGSSAVFILLSKEEFQ